MKYPEKPWRVTCPGCKSKEWISPRQSGETYTCPKCKKSFQAADHVKHTKKTAPVRKKTDKNQPAVIIWDKEYPIAADESELCRLGARHGKAAAFIYLKDLVFFEQEVSAILRKKGKRFHSAWKAATDHSELCCGICSQQIPQDTIRRVRRASNLETYQDMPETERNLARDPVCYRCTSRTVYYVFWNPEGPIQSWWEYWLGRRRRATNCTNGHE